MMCLRNHLDHNGHVTASVRAFDTPDKMNTFYITTRDLNLEFQNSAKGKVVFEFTQKYGIFNIL